MAELHDKCDTAVESAVKEAIKAADYDQQINKFEIPKECGFDGIKHDRGSIFLINQSSRSILAGHGKLFLNFVKAKNIHVNKGKQVNYLEPKITQFLTIYLRMAKLYIQIFML